MTLFHCLYFSYFCNSVAAVSAGYFGIKRILYCIIDGAMHKLTWLPSCQLCLIIQHDLKVVPTFCLRAGKGNGIHV